MFFGGDKRDRTVEALNAMAHEQYPRQSRGDCSRGADLCMKMEEYLRVVESDVASCKLNLGDGESVLSLLYEAYSNNHRMYNDQIKADFAELYQLLNGMPLREMDWIINPVCALCRDHERNGFLHGVQLGAQLVQEIQSDK